MARTLENINQLLDHPNLGVLIYAANIAVWIPLVTWRDHPVLSFAGVAGGAFVSSMVEKFLPFSNRHVRMLSLAHTGLGVGLGIRNLCITPDLVSIPKEPSLMERVVNLLPKSEPWTVRATNTYGYANTWKDGTPIVTIADASQLESTLTSLLPGPDPVALKELAAYLKPLPYDAVFLHEATTPVALITTTADPAQVISINMSVYWTAS